jgi:hypothetical protein
MSRIAIPQRSAVLARGEVLFFWLEARDASRRNPHPKRALDRPNCRPRWSRLLAPMVV